MTILNVARSPSRVLIAVDTIGGHAKDGSPVEATKILHAPVSNLVIASRGIAGLLHGVFRALIEQPASFDEWRTGLAEVCAAAVGPMDARMRELGLPAPAIEQNLELVLAGWSDAAGSMQAACFRKPPGTTAFERHPVDPYLLMPGEPWFGKPFPPTPDTPEKMLAYGRRQLAWWKQNLSGLPAGGRLMLAELTRQKMTISSLEF